MSMMRMLKGLDEECSDVRIEVKSEERRLLTKENI